MSNENTPQKKIIWIYGTILAFFFFVMWMIVTSYKSKYILEEYMGLTLKKCNIVPINFISSSMSLSNCQFNSTNNCINKINIKYSYPIILGDVRKISISNCELKIKNGKIFFGDRILLDILGNGADNVNNFDLENVSFFNEGGKNIVPNCNVKIRGNNVKIFISNKLAIEIQKKPREIKILDKKGFEIIKNLLWDIIYNKESSTFNNLEELFKLNNLFSININLVQEKPMVTLYSNMNNGTMDIHLNDKLHTINILSGFLHYYIFTEDEFYFKGVSNKLSNISLTNRDNLFYGSYKGKYPQEEIGLFIPDLQSYIKPQEIHSYEFSWKYDNNNKDTIIDICKVQCDAEIEIPFLGRFFFKNGSISYKKNCYALVAQGILDIFGKLIETSAKYENGKNKLEFSIPVQCKHADSQFLTAGGEVKVTGSFEGIELEYININLSDLNLLSFINPNPQDIKDINLNSTEINIKKNNNDFNVTGKLFDYKIDITISQGKIVGELSKCSNVYEISSDYIENELNINLKANEDTGSSEEIAILIQHILKILHNTFKERTPINKVILNFNIDQTNIQREKVIEYKVKYKISPDGKVPLNSSWKNPQV